MIDSDFNVVKGLNKIIGIGAKNTELLFELIRCVLVHDVACQAVEVETGKLKEADIKVPELGTISITYNKAKGIQYTFSPDKKFETALLNAITTGKSELMEKAEEALVCKIKERYESLI